jgi:hypothetical protein
MSFTIGDFRASAARLGQGDEIKAKTDGSGLATSGWARFKLAVSEIFTGRATLQARQQDMITEFKGALRREYGDELANIANNNISRMIGTGPLTKQAVESTIAMMEARGGQHHMRNETMIRSMSQLVVMGPRSIAEGIEAGQRQGSLSQVLNEVAPDILEAARQNGLDPERLRALREQCDTTGGPGLDFREVDGVSETIARKLREASVDRDRSQAMGEKVFRPLGREEALQIARDAAKEALLRNVNGGLQNQYQKAHPFADRLAERMQAAGLGDHIGLIDQHGTAELVSFAVQDADHVLSMDELATMTDRIIDRQIERMREKLDRIEALGLPEGRAKAEIVEQSLGTRSRMDANYFQAMDGASRELRGLLEAVAGAETPEEADRILLESAARLMKLMRDAGLEGSDDIVRFGIQTAALMLGRGEASGDVALRDLVADERNDAITERLGNLADFSGGSEEAMERTSSVMALTRFVNYANGIAKEM